MPKPQPTVREYRVVADGINWPDPAASAPSDPATYARADHRADRGDMVRDLPPEIAEGFLDSGKIESLTGANQTPAPGAPKSAEE